MVIELKVGDVVLSKMGRDQGRYFLVTSVVNGDYVTVADGEVRKVAKPKLKKKKHLKPEGTNLEVLAEKFLASKQVFDSELRSALRKFNEQTEVKGV